MTTAVLSDYYRDLALQEVLAERRLAATVALIVVLTAPILAAPTLAQTPRRSEK